MDKQYKKEACPVEKQFGDLSLAENQSKLNEYLKDKSYLSHACPSSLDVAAYRMIKLEPSETFLNLRRWWRHLKSYENEFKALPSGSF